VVQRKTVAVLSTAFLARLAVFFLAANGFFLVGEGAVQANLAENILSGRGFMLSESMLSDSDPRRNSALAFFRETGGFYGALIPERPTSFLVPGYAIFQAFIFMITSPGNLLAVVSAQLALGVLTVYLGMRLASRFLSGFWYTAAGFFMALDPFEIYYQAIPATQALFSLLFVSGLLLSIRFLEKPCSVRGITAGLMWGVTFMVRPAALPMVIWLLAVFLFSRRATFKSLLPAGFALLVFFASLTPWMLRNRNTMGRYQLLPLQGGVQLWEYNGRLFTDHFETEQEGARLLYGPVREFWAEKLEKPHLAAFPVFTDQGEFERDSILNARQMEFLMANPGLFIHLSMCRFVEFFKPFPLNDFSPAHTVIGLLSFFWVGVFFAAGTILILHRGPPGVFLAGVIAGYILMHLLTASGTPHRVALDIPLFIASLVGLKHTLERFRSGKDHK